MAVTERRGRAAFAGGSRSREARVSVLPELCEQEKRSEGVNEMEEGAGVSVASLSARGASSYVARERRRASLLLAKEEEREKEKENCKNPLKFQIFTKRPFSIKNREKNMNLGAFLQR